jgi:hypothetical protein
VQIRIVHCNTWDYHWLVKGRAKYVTPPTIATTPTSAEVATRALLKASNITGGLGWAASFCWFDISAAAVICLYDRVRGYRVINNYIYIILKIITIEIKDDRGYRVINNYIYIILKIITIKVPLSSFISIITRIITRITQACLYKGTFLSSSFNTQRIGSLGLLQWRRMPPSQRTELQSRTCAHRPATTVLTCPDFGVSNKSWVFIGFMVHFHGEVLFKSYIN